MNAQVYGLSEKATPNLDNRSAQLNEAENLVLQACEKYKAIVRDLQTRVQELNTENNLLQKTGCNSCEDTLQSLELLKNKHAAEIKEKEDTISRLQCEYKKLQSTNEELLEYKRCREDESHSSSELHPNRRSKRKRISSSSNVNDATSTRTIVKRNDRNGKNKFSGENEQGLSPCAIMVPETLEEDMGLQKLRWNRPTSKENDMTSVMETVDPAEQYCDSSDSFVFNRESTTTATNETSVSETDQIINAEPVRNPRKQSSKSRGETSEITGEQHPRKSPIKLSLKSRVSKPNLNTEKSATSSPKKASINSQEPAKSGMNFRNLRSQLHNVSGDDFEPYRPHQSKPKSTKGGENSVNNGRKESTGSSQKSKKNNFGKLVHFSPAQKGHRKPKYKQTTLTQDIFYKQSHLLNDVDEPLQRAAMESLKDVKRKDTVELSSTNQKDLAGVTDKSSYDKEVSEVDLIEDNWASLDETFVPTQFLQKPRTAAAAAHVAQTEMTMDDSIHQEDPVSDASEDLLDEMVKALPKQKNSQNHDKRRKQQNSKDSFGDSDDDSVPCSPHYKYQGDPVRKKEDRRKLDGHACRDCVAYIDTLGLSESQKQKRLNECSRHRFKHAPPPTPDHFWSLDFPSTQECKDRGILDHTQHEPLRKRNRRPLKK